MVTAVVHSRDLDGHSSGAIIKLKYPDCKVIGFDYGQDLPYEEIKSGEPIIMADVSMKMPQMLELAKYSNWQLTFIDHHKSAIEDYKKFVGDGESFCTAVLEDGISACEGTWKYLFPDKQMPRAIKYLGIYDTWRKNESGFDWENEVLPFQFGMRMFCNSPETFPTELFTDDSLTIGIIEKGKTILQYQAQVNEVNCRNSFEIKFEGLRAICLNGAGFNSDVFKSVYDESKHDMMMPFKFDGKTKQWIISMYGTKDIDLSLIAKKYKGGGHKSACGFQVDDIKQLEGFKSIML